MTEDIPYMMDNTRAEFERVRDLTWPAPPVQVDCWCITCEAMVLEARTMNGDQDAWADARFIVCPICGNKRCPRANHHDNLCTGSNATGQAGSAWEHVE